MIENAQDLIDRLTYINYAFNRERSPHVSVERWARLYGPNTGSMEARYQAEKLIAKVAA
jgi:hypothetical protein